MNLPLHIQEVMEQSTCLHTTEEVDAAIDRMAADITEKLADTNPILLCVMIGGIVPAGILLPRLNFPLEVDYIHATRYHGNIQGGELKWKIAPDTRLAGRTVILLDDVLDHGNTLTAIVKHCEGMQAAAVYTAVLVDKAYPRGPDVIQQADFTGLNVINRYIFGYGMDYKEYLRNAPGIYMVAPEHEV